ncbi:MAG TPA: DUF4838 domain-containing protein [bacterium]|nr:DUF4838 domain-containing protein [bacterium]
MRKTIISVLMAVFLCSACILSCQTKDLFYGGNIFVEENASQKLKDIAQELGSWLAKGTGKNFNITMRIPESGIFLLDANSQNLPKQLKNALKDKGKEAFVLFSQDSDRLYISGNSNAAIQYGIYRYLEILGYRWFFPGENWTIIPSLKNITMNINKLESPAFKQRDFFGTGGFGGKLPIDQEMKLAKRWEEWKKRNFLGGEIRISGHAGEAFNTANKAILLQHPEYLAEIGGKRQPWSPGTKPCYSNPGLIELYVNDRLKQLKRQIDADPDGPGSFAVSVEPSDGGGHCECAECKKLGTVSDRVFSLANHVAKEVANQYPGKYVSLLAYNEHAAVPDIALEPNVYVVVVPYGFQRTGYSGDELIQMWGKKIKFFGVYDYWSIPDWTNDMPSLNYLEIPEKKIKFWHKNHVAAFLSESTYSSGAVGITWYISSRILWNPDIDEKQLLEDFYKKAFGEAEKPIRRMLERWAKSFMLTDHELALSFRDISEADKLAKNPQVKARIDDYKKYLIYLSLFYDYTSEKPGSPERKQAVENLLNFMWRIYDSTMVHVYRMHQLIVNRYESDPDLRQQWDFKNKEKWESIKPVTSEELDKMVKNGIEKYRAYDFEPKEYDTGRLVPVKDVIDVNPESKYLSTNSFHGNHTFVFYVPEGVQNLTLRITVGKRENHPGDRCIVRDDAKRVVFDSFIQPDGMPHEITIPVKEKTSYTMDVSDQKLSFFIEFPDWLPFVVVNHIVIFDWQKKVYFFVPEKTKKVGMFSGSVIPIKIYDGDGKEVQYEGTKIIVADVADKQDGKLWSFSHHKLYTPSPIMLNVPKVFGFSRDTMMIPVECKK